MPFHQAPFIRLLLPFSLGIILSSYFPHKISGNVTLTLTILFITLSFVVTKLKISSYHLRWLTGGILNLALFTLGYLLAVNQIEIFDNNHFSKFKSNNIVYQGIVISDPVINEKTTKVRLHIIHSIEDSTIHSTSGKCLAYLQNDTNLKCTIGDTILFQSNPVEVSPPQNPSEFNYKRYLFHHQIFHQAYVPFIQMEIRPKTQQFNLKETAFTIRSKLLNQIKQYGFEKEEYAIISALVLGKKDYLDDDITHAYSSAGAMHVLAVSGLHVGIIYILLNQLLFFFNASRKLIIIKGILLILGIWGFAFISGLSPSVIRAATMFSFLIVGNSLKKNTNIYNTLALSAFVILLFKPYMIMEVGFQLSYLAVLGIVYLQPKIVVLFSPNVWLIKKAWEITTVSIAAQIATAPLGFLYFHQFPNYFLFSNLVVIPAAFAILILGILLLISSPVFYIANSISILLNLIVKLLNTLVLMIDQLPYSLTEGIDISVFETWLLYTIIVCSSIFLFHKRKKALIPTLLITNTLISIQIFENIEQQNYKSIIFYNIKNETAIDFIDGNSHYLLASKKLTSNKSKMLFHIQHYWWKLNSPKITPDIVQFNSDSSLIGFNNKTLLIYTPMTLMPETNIEVDYLYIKSYRSKHPLSNISFKTLIIGNEINNQSRINLKRIYRDKVIVDLKKDGHYCT